MSSDSSVEIIGNDEYERRIISDLLGRERAAELVRSEVSAADFAFHGALYQAILDIIDDDGAPDLDLVCARVSSGYAGLSRQFKYDVTFLFTMIHSVETQLPLEDVAQAVKELAAKRRALTAAEQFAANLRNGHTVAEAIGKHREELSGIEVPWQAPIPIAKYDAPEFPIKVLPAWCKYLAEEIAAVYQVDPAMPGALILGALAGASMGRYAVKFKTGVRPQELPLFVVAVLPTGNRKSDPYRDIMAPFFDWQKQSAATNRARTKEVAARLKLTQKSIGKLESSGDTSQADKLSALYAEIDSLNVPPARSLVMENYTEEAMVDFLAANAERAIVASDEGGPLLNLGRYSDNPQINLLLQAHGGSPHTYHRKTNNQKIFFERPLVSMLLTVQPDVLEDISKHREFRGRGFLARILFAPAKSLVGYRMNPLHTAQPRPGVVEAYRENIARILDAPGTGDKGTDPHVLRMTPRASVIWAEYHDQRELRIRQGGDLKEIEEFASKLEGLLCRLAGLLHIADAVEQNQPPESRDIHDGTMSRAVELADYFVSCAKIANSQLGGNEQEMAAEKVLRWIRSSERESFRREEVRLSLRKSLESDQIDGAMIMLQRHKWIRETIKPNDKNKPTISYSVNPATFGRPR